MGGPTGLDYALLPLLFSSFGVKKKQRFEVLEDLQVMEQEALRVMAENSRSASK